MLAAQKKIQIKDKQYINIKRVINKFEYIHNLV